jgi:phosphoglycolate phosphatase-like HAD superfamily hydrolase
MERCLIVDFDDTLVKTIDVHADSWKHALERVLNMEIPIESILADINYGMDILLKKYQLSPAESLLAQKYKKEIFAKNIHKTKVNELLLYIIESGFFENYIIASNSSKENIDKIMIYHGISPSMFSMILSRDDVKEKKPHPEMGKIIFDTFSDIYTKTDYLMIGDSEVDLTFARKLDIKCILVNS